MLVVSPAGAAIIYDESVQGDLVDFNTFEDLDGNVLGFTGGNLGTLAAGPGGVISSVAGTTDGNSADIFTVTVAAGTQIDSVRFGQYAGGDDNLFLAVQDQPFFPENFYFDENAFTVNSSDFFGGAVIGLTEFQNNTDTLPTLGAGNIGRGFTGPIGQGDYTFYVQQTNGPTDYQFDLSVSSVTAVPEPSSLAAISLIAIAARRRRAKG